MAPTMIGFVSLPLFLTTLLIVLNGYLSAATRFMPSKANSNPVSAMAATIDDDPDTVLRPMYPIPSLETAPNVHAKPAIPELPSLQKPGEPESTIRDPNPEPTLEQKWFPVFPFPTIPTIPRNPPKPFFPYIPYPGFEVPDPGNSMDQKTPETQGTPGALETPVAQETPGTPGIA
ncbi:hypothetical protein Scep_005171 [Stephania cephalantha]|uniref:Uncharacterized protein n=1 Tax=Stephania cephalantha TaxID=152367 RepID=A0AAP0KVI6_9MAGN